MQAAVSPRSCLVWQLIQLASKTLLFFFFFLSFFSSAKENKRMPRPATTPRQFSTRHIKKWTDKGRRPGQSAREGENQATPFRGQRTWTLAQNAEPMGWSAVLIPHHYCFLYTCGWCVHCTLVGGVYSVHLWVACTVCTLVGAVYIVHFKLEGAEWTGRKLERQKWKSLAAAGEAWKAMFWPNKLQLFVSEAIFTNQLKNKQLTNIFFNALYSH